MSKRPRYQVLALWLLGERYEADGWLEIRTHGPDLKSWESRCKVVAWNHRDLTGSSPISVRVELAAGGKLSGTAFVDQGFHLLGNDADLKIHGTSQRLRVGELGPGDYVATRRGLLGNCLAIPFRVLVFLLVAVATIALVILFIALVSAPWTLLPAPAGF